MLKIAVDAMGGDYAPASEVEGAIEAARDLGVGVILVGRSDAIQAELDKPIPASAQAWEKERLAKRKANAAATLLRFDRPEKVWPLFRHSNDPGVRSFLLHRAAKLRNSS